MVQAVAGTTLSLLIAEEGADLPPGGTWEAQLGTITAGGDYTAPSYIPPYGVDVVLYHSPDGQTAALTVFILPNPNIPQSSQALYQTVTTDFLSLPPDPFATPTPTPTPTSGGPSTYSTTSSADASAAQEMSAEESTATVEPSEPEPSEPQPFATPGYTVPLVTSSEQYAQPVEEYDCIEIEAVGIASTTSDMLYELPSRVGATPVRAVQLRQSGSKPKPKKCKVGPYNPPPPWDGDPCTGGTRVVNGPRKTYQRFGPLTSMGSIKVTAEISKQLIGLGFKGVAEGVYSITGQYIYYGAAYTRDVYGCVNGRWKFLYREACEAKAIGLITAPPWAAVLWGHKKNGAPGPWTPWTCHKTN